MDTKYLIGPAFVLATAIAVAPLAPTEQDSPPGPASVAFFGGLTLTTSSDSGSTVVSVPLVVAGGVPDGTMDQAYDVMLWEALRPGFTIQQG